MKTKQWIVVGLLGACLSLPSLALAAGGKEAPHDKAAGAQSDIQGNGQLKAINPKNRTVNIQHEAIAALGWPAMTMDISVGAGVDLQALQPGQKVQFTLLKAADNAVQITKITPLP